jgi:hypothetical protein
VYFFRKFLLSILILSALLSYAQAQDVVEKPSQEKEVKAQERSLGGRILFWFGAGLAMMFVGRFLFKEQMHERKIIRLLTDQIGPYYREFDPVNLHRWLERATPYFFDALKHQSVEKLKPFAFESFTDHWHQQFEQQKTKGEIYQSRFMKLLKVHPIGIYPQDGQQPPLGVEVVLRAEIKGIFEVITKDQQLKDTQNQERQIQFLWILKHDGFHWKIYEIREIFDDIVGLNEKKELPPLIDWAKPNQFRKDEYLQNEDEGAIH